MTLNKLYNLTCEGRQFVSINSPKAVPECYYSLVEISYDKVAIKTIKGIYVGKDITEISECIIEDLEINKVIKSNNIENTYTDKLENYIKSLDSDDKINVIKSIDIIDFNEDEDDIKLIKLFLCGLGSILTYYHFMSVNQQTIGHPFHPVQFEFPVPTIDLSVLDQNLAEYLSYPAKILMNISTKNHGKLWMEQLIDFWNIWGVLFPKELDLGSPNDIIYESILGYGNHLYNQTASMCKYFQSAENIITDGCDHIQKATEESLNIVKNTNLSFQKKFRYASLLITTISTTVLKTIKLECDYSLNEIIECKDKCVLDMKSVSNKTIDNIERIREECRNEINKISNRHLWDCVPEIVEKVRHDVGKIINHNVSRRIESKFSDVMADYKEQAKNRLAEVLNPIVVQKVELFKEEADKAILKVKNHGNRAREHTNRSGNLVVKINKMEKRVDNIESDMSNSYIQTQINDIKKDMEEMKDMVSKIVKMLNIS